MRVELLPRKIIAKTKVKRRVVRDENILATNRFFLNTATATTDAAARVCERGINKHGCIDEKSLSYDRCGGCAGGCYHVGVHTHHSGSHCAWRYAVER
jgi:hypothetical protein